MRSRSTVLLRTIAVALATTCGAAPAPQETPEPAEIVVVGVIHAPGLFMTPAMSPAHVRACLDALRPAALAVESNPEWFSDDRYYRETYETESVAVPWALARGVAVYGIDWIGDTSDHASERERLRAVRSERDALASAVPERSDYRYGPVRDDQFDGTPDVTDFTTLNGDEYGRGKLAWIDAGKDKEGSAAAYMDARDGHIADRIATVAERHASERVLVLIGAAHKADLERRLRERGFRIGDLDDVEAVYPIHDPRSMDHLLTALDAAAILLTSFETGGWRIENARRTFLLGKLRDVPVARAQTWYRYIQARRAMLAGRIDAARRGFEHVTSHGADTPFPYRGTSWRLHLTVRQAAHLELGRIADLEGDRDTAVTHYRAALDGIEVPEYSEDYHSEFLYLARARNALRSLVHEPFTLSDSRSDRP